MDSDLLSAFFWITWVSTFLWSKAIGVFNFIAGLLPDEFPHHNIKWIPQLDDALPALITAAICAILSAILRRLVDKFWTKYFSDGKESK